MVRSVDFAATLSGAVARRTPHFALHHRSAVRPEAPLGLSGAKISTETDPVGEQPVEDFFRPAPSLLGIVVPKRHARRAVTRSLLKRQIRAAAERHAHGLGPGLWIVRLRAPFDRERYPSAASSALKREARAELDQLLAEGRPR